MFFVLYVEHVINFVACMYLSNKSIKILQLLSFSKYKNRVASGLLMVLVLVGCRSTRYVPADKYLLNSVKFSIDNTSVNKKELESCYRQTPNKTILWLFRFHLWLYNQSNTEKDTWLNRNLQKAGEAPKIWDRPSSDLTLNYFKRYLERRGYYNATITDTFIYKKRKVDVLYRIKTGKPYIINSFKYFIEDTAIRQYILSDTINSLIKPGPDALFDKDVLGNERIRIETRLRNNGFYRFGRENIDFDTAMLNNQVDLKINIRSNQVQISDTQILVIPHKQYKINQVVVNTDLQEDQADDVPQTSRDTVNKYGVKFIYHHNYWVHPSIIQQSNYVLPGSLFKLSDVDGTKSHLFSLNVYDVVNTNQFKELPYSDTSAFGYLNAQISLVPHKIQTYNLEVVGTSTSGNIGGGVNLVYQHRSLFGNAENLNLTLSGALESRGTNALQRVDKKVGANATLVIPKFLLPFNSINFKKKYNPKTSFAVSYEYQKRFQQFTSLVTNFSFGYSWKGGEYITHIVTPIDLSLVNYSQLDTANYFYQFENTPYKNTFNNHIISAISYSYIYKNQRPNNNYDYHYFRWNIETAGNALTVYKKLQGEVVADTGYYTFFNIRYSQYLRTDIDYHYCHVLNDISNIVYRVYAGLGNPYGNAIALPYEKQFSLGGANSNRAWGVSSLVGSYKDTANYPSSRGDIKLEANIEYRFKLIPPILEGALFTDVGNVWAILKDQQRAGAEFTWDKFYKQIAISSGTGIRLNFTYFLVRFDVGVKMHDPSQSTGRQWIFNRNRITWKDDFAISIGIGYPF
jgi:hypothetical protein